MRARSARRLIWINGVGAFPPNDHIMGWKDRLFIAVTVLSMLGAVALCGVVLF
jgi:hypothetical protein